MLLAALAPPPQRGSAPTPLRVAAAPDTRPLLRHPTPQHPHTGVSPRLMHPSLQLSTSSSPNHHQNLNRHHLAPRSPSWRRYMPRSAAARVAIGFILVVLLLIAASSFNLLASLLVSRPDSNTAVLGSQHNDIDFVSLHDVAANYTPIYIDGKRTIPRNIFMTSKDIEDVSVGEFRNLNPHYYARMFNDDAANDLVRRNFPKHVHDAYSSLPKPVLRADFFRYIVLYLFGGIYSDTDTVCLKPIDSWITPNDDIEFIAGVENDQTSNPEWQLSTYARQLQILQWTVISRPFHPILACVIDRISLMTPRLILLFNILGESDRYKMILDWTGPGVFSDCVLDFVEGKNLRITPDYYKENGFPSNDEITKMAKELVIVRDRLVASDKTDGLKAKFAEISREIYRGSRIRSTHPDAFIQDLHAKILENKPIVTKKLMIAPRYYLSPGINVGPLTMEEEFANGKISHLFHGSWKGGSLW